MAEQPTEQYPDLKAWMLFHHTRDLLFRSQDRVLGESGLTTEQYTVLAGIRCLDAPVTVADLARWIGHKGNTVSMIADRMVNAGLLRRMRDQPDRRLVRLSITKKAEEAFKQATPALCQYIKQTLAPLTNEDKLTLIRLLTTLREQVLHTGSADPAIPDLETYETRDTADITTRLRQYLPTPGLKIRWEC